MKHQNKEKSCILYINQPLETMESFKCLALKVPSNHILNKCATHYLELGKEVYYAFENTYNNGKNKSWALKKYLFNTR